MQVQPVKKDCCKKMAAMACHHKPAKKQSKDCDEPFCTMMFSCVTCGFLVKERMQIVQVKAAFLPKPVPLYKIGDLSAYHSSCWKPPRAC